MKLADDELVLQTGLKIRPAAEVRTHFGECRIVPGGTTSLPLTVQSNASMPLRGRIEFDPLDPPLTVAPMKSDIKLTPEGLAGTIVEVSANKELPPGTYDLWATLHLQEKGDSSTKIKTRKYRIPVYNIPEGTVAVGEDDRTRELHVVSTDYSARIAREGGQVQILSQIEQTPSLVLRNEVGPPFGLSPFRFAEQEITVNQSNTSIVVSLAAIHPERPLQVVTRLTFPFNSSQILQETLVTNTGKESHSFQLRLLGPPGGISFAPGTVIAPLASGIIEEATTSNIASYPSIPTTPDTFSESWIAIKVNSLAIGQIWDPENLEEILVSTGRIGRLDYHEVTLAPSEQRCLSRVWHILRAPNWTAIQRIWQEKFKQYIPSLSEIRAPTEPDSLLRITPPTIVLPHREKVTQEFSLHYSANSPLTGPLSVKPPEGWSSTLGLQGEKSSDSTIMLSEITSSNPPTVHLVLSPTKSVPDKFTIFEGNMVWQTPVQTTQPFSLIQLGRSGTSVDVSEEREDDLRVFRVKNGLLEFTVSPDFGGCLYSLKNQQSTELLCSAFPTPRPKIFLQNYRGGIQPIISGIDEDIFQAKTNLEKMEAKPYSLGAAWKGVEISWKSKLQPVCRGVNFALRYLTAPGSPLILVDWIFRNTTTAPLRLFTVLLTDIAFNGSLAESVLQARWNNQFTEIQPSPTPVVFIPDTNVVWLRRTSSSSDPPEGLAFLVAGKMPNLLAIHIGMAAWVGNFNDSFWLRPGEERFQRSCLVVDPPDSDTLEALQRSLHDL
jgi:hypothetical protein